MDGGAAFFYNTTTQRPDGSQRPSPLTNISFDSQAQPIRPLFKKKSTKSKAQHTSSNPDSNSRSSNSTDNSSHVATSRGGFPDLEHPELDHMLATPLPDYRHSANQTSKARAAAQARKNSTTSGSSADRKHALHLTESRTTTGPPTRADPALGRSSSISSQTGSNSLTTVTSSEPPPTDALLRQPFARRHGRRYLRDTTLPYPLPSDLNELHRQTLRTMLLCQVFNGVVCSPVFRTKPPKKVLEVGCGTGFWSVSAHKHFSRQGFPSVSFTGIDIAPISPHPDPDDDMNWRFVQHDLRRTPLPFRDEEFNLIMIKDLSLVTPTTGMQQTLMDEYIRILKPGGVLEIWDGDHSLRMLMPQIPPTANDDSDEEEEEEDEYRIHTNATGTYTLTTHTYLAQPHNQHLIDFNTWIAKALEPRQLTPMPCTAMRPMLFQESDLLEDIDSRRLAIPLGQVRWEREGVGGGSDDLLAAIRGKSREFQRRVLTTGQKALRQTALTTVVQMIDSLEPLLREASGKGQDEWDRWYGSMMTDLLQNNGTSWGECLEVGAWWARKKLPPG